jgi:hypothetical protein
LIPLLFFAIMGSATARALEVLEQLDAACGWMLNNNIIIPNSEHILSLCQISDTTQ